jgi:hypothetical protein
MNSRSDREEVLTAVTSAPKLPYNKDDKRQKNENVLVGTLRIYNPYFPFTFLIWLCAARIRQIDSLH